MTDWDAFEEACVQHGVRLSAYAGGDLDLPTAEGPTTAGWRPCGPGGKARSRASKSARPRIARRARDAGSALRYFTLDGTDHASHKEQASMIRRYIIWRNNHAYCERLRRIVNRATQLDAALNLAALRSIEIIKHVSRSLRIGGSRS